VQEQATLKPLPQFVRRQAHLSARGGARWRWLTYETHGFADAPVWGQATREDIRQFEWDLIYESKKRCIEIDELMEEIFHTCFWAGDGSAVHAMLLAGNRKKRSEGVLDRGDLPLPGRL
jgi:hypothetical protein